jgi:uncharacterized paraquat-inducible protein A
MYHNKKIKNKLRNKGELTIFYDEFHMMDWDLGHWIPMIFGWGIFLLAAIVILYMIIQFSFKANEKNQMKILVPKGKNNELKAHDHDKENFEKPSFCYSCGEKLDRRELEYCPKCGTKIK